MGFGGDFVLTLFTNSLELARHADRAGIQRIGLDLERIGKAQRQGHLRTWVSNHVEEEVAAIGASLQGAKLFVRVNPIHPGFEEEIERFVAAGTKVLMLPMFTTAQEVGRFIEAVGDRAHPVLLLETAQAAFRIHEITRIPGVREIHIGLNDLRLSLGLPNHFEVLASDLMDGLCRAVRDAGIRLAVGGIGRAGDNALPVPSDLVYAQYPRLTASGALVSRAFFPASSQALDLRDEVARARARLDYFAALSAPQLDEYRHQLRGRIEALRAVPSG